MTYQEADVRAGIPVATGTGTTSLLPAREERFAGVVVST